MCQTCQPQGVPGPVPAASTSTTSEGRRPARHAVRPSGRASSRPHTSSPRRRLRQRKAQFLSQSGPSRSLRIHQVQSRGSTQLPPHVPAPHTRPHRADRRRLAVGQSRATWSTHSDSKTTTERTEARLACREAKSSDLVHTLGFQDNESGQRREPLHLSSWLRKGGICVSESVSP